VAAVAELIAHGGVVGAIAESVVVVAVTSVFVAVWVRERRARKEQAHEGPARLTDRDAD
jgi:cytochrome c oxidase assembly factor CtaG